MYCARSTCPVASVRNSRSTKGTISRDYDPAPGLEDIRAAVTAINFEDDERNPPELGIMEREIRRIADGQYVLVPASDRTRGHASVNDAMLWKDYLLELLARSTR